MPRRFTMLDAAAVAAFAMVTTILIERSHQRDINASSPAVVVAATAASSCREMLENRRFAVRRIMIADGSLPLGNTWRNDALLDACPAN
jgi:hypothetical protein